MKLELPDSCYIQIAISSSEVAILDALPGIYCRGIGLFLQEQWIAEPRNFSFGRTEKVGGRRPSSRDVFEKRSRKVRGGDGGTVVRTQRFCPLKPGWAKGVFVLTTNFPPPASFLSPHHRKYGSIHWSFQEQSRGGIFGWLYRVSSLLLSYFLCCALRIRHFPPLTLSREFVYFSLLNLFHSSFGVQEPESFLPFQNLARPFQSSKMDSSPVSPHVCELDASPDIHNPSPCDLYRRMVMQEQLVMESTQRSKRRSLVRRGWARVKVTVTKWVDGMNEARGRFLDFSKKIQSSKFLTCSFLPILRSSPSLPNISELAPRACHMRLLEYFSLNPPQQLHLHLDRPIRRANEPNRELLNRSYSQPQIPRHPFPGRNLPSRRPFMFTNSSGHPPSGRNIRLATTKHPHPYNHGRLTYANESTFNKRRERDVDAESRGAGEDVSTNESS